MCTRTTDTIISAGSDDSSDYSRSNTSIASTPRSETPPESPLIQSLKGAGVLYIKYSELVLEKELGSVSHDITIDQSVTREVM